MKVVKIFKLLAAAVAAFALSACSSITNLSPEKVPQNPSNVYTLSMSAYINDGAIVAGSIKPFIVIDEKTILMKEVSTRAGERMYETEYVMPPNRTEAKYYYVVKYKSDTGAGGIVEREIYSPTLYELKPAARYVMNMQFDRGPIGTIVAVLGRGFNSQDKVKFGNVYADIDSVSRNSVNFIVPPLEAGKTYDVEVESGSDTSWIGQFRIDPSEITLSYDRIEVAGGDTVQVIFDIGFLAPEGGYVIDVQTNIPSSVIMPEVVVQPGKSSVVVPIKGASAGEGKLFINALGFREKVVPIVVTLPSIEARSSSDKIQSKISELDSE